jgi:hypothetical protein
VTFSITIDPFRAPIFVLSVPIFFDYCNSVEIVRNTELQPLVDAIVRRGFVEPAIFLLEMSKPLVGCMRELYAMSEPLMQVILGPSLAPALKRALQSSDETEILIAELERTRERDRCAVGEGSR